MRAVRQTEAYGPLAVAQIPVPRPGPGQVLVRMHAAPLNPSDLGVLMGAGYGAARVYPFTPGVEGSGMVVAAGPGLMPRLFVGRRVACSGDADGDGTWAEYMVTSAQLCIPLLPGVSLEQGATLIVNPLTALALLEIAARGRHRALVSTAAASALGGMIQRLAARRGLPVINIVRKAQQVEMLRAQGAAHVLNSEDPDFPAQLGALAAQLKATLWLDAIGGALTQTLCAAAPQGSTVLLYSRLSLQDSQIDARTALLKELHLDGWFLANWLRHKNLFQTLMLARQAQSLLATDLNTQIAARLPLEQAQAGLDRYVGAMSAGKILLLA